MVLGAAGVNLGSRFLVCEAPVGERWRKALTARPSEDWVQADFINAPNPNPGTVGYGNSGRLLRTDWVERGKSESKRWKQIRRPALGELAEAVAAGEREELLVVGGQSAGLIEGVEPAGAIVLSLVAEARATLGAASAIEL